MGRPSLELLILRATRAVFGVALLTITLIGAPLQVPTYTSDIAPLLAERCGMCHVPEGSAPFSLLTYADAKRYAAEIAAATRTRYMPPWKADLENGPFAGQRPLTDDEIDRIQESVAGGAAEGERADERATFPKNPRRRRSNQADGAWVRLTLSSRCRRRTRYRRRVPTSSAFSSFPCL